jgi:hypothetical protein
MKVFNDDIGYHLPLLILVELFQSSELNVHLIAILTGIC